LDRRAGLACELGNRLADVAIVANHLFERKALLQQVTPMQCRHFADVDPRIPRGRPRQRAVVEGFAGLLDRQGLDELIEENGYPMRQLVIGRFRFGPAHHHDPTPVDQNGAVRREKVVQHA